jgi:LPXTG-motif cell wall-anchored protein
MYKKTTTETVEETTEHKSQSLAVNPDGTLNFEGLGAGTYTIKETVVPEGYTKAQDVTVVITFNNTTQKFTATVNGTATTADAATNLFPVDVVNVAGNVLPTTGGIGTTLFYIIGGVLVAAAAVLLVTRRRMNAR